MKKLPGRDGHGVRNAGRRADNRAVVSAGYVPGTVAPGKVVVFADGTRYQVGHFGLFGPQHKGERPEWGGAELRRLREVRKTWEAA